MIESHELGHLKITPGGVDDLEQQISAWIADKGSHACIPLNITKYEMARDDKKLADAINNVDMVVADGMPIQWLAHKNGWKNVERVTGVELAERLLSKAKENNWRLYFFGANPNNLKNALENIKIQFNDPIIAGARDGYFKGGDIPDIIQDINNSKPDILFLGLGLPQKEYFINDHLPKLDVPFCITVGGAIDIWAGAKKRAPAMVQKLGLEWLYRSFYDLSRSALIFRYGFSFLKDFLSLPRRNK